MLKYVIAFYSISFYGSIASYVGCYTQVILVQQSPITGFFGPQLFDGNQFGTGDDVLEYFAEHWGAFNAQRWVINGFWPINLREEPLMFCTDLNRNNLVYHHNDLNAIFREEQLKDKWPVLELYRAEQNLWSMQYNRHGSCVTDSVNYYFEEAVRLVDNFNIGTILADARIFPGTSYEFSRIVTVISNRLQRRFFIKCLRDPRTNDQYLFEIHVCFNRLHNLANCRHRHRRTVTLHECNVTSSVIYPGRPRFIDV